MIETIGEVSGMKFAVKHTPPATKFLFMVH